MPRILGPTVRRRRLGAELRRLREARGLKLEDVAPDFGMSRATIGRIETADVGVSSDDVLQLLDIYEVRDEGQRQALVALARQAKRRGWWHSYKGLVAGPYADLISLESDATATRTWEPQYVPGLLQTEGYARAVTEASRFGVGEDALEQFVAVRMQRQQVLTRKANSLRIQAVIWEPALRMQIGEPGVMRAQLERLVELSGLPHVDIQVLPMPTEAHAGMQGGFSMLDFGSSVLDVVVLESMTAMLYLEEEDEIERYDRVFNDLRASALSYGESKKFLAGIAKEC